jgi:hypothetical protein
MAMDSLEPLHHALSHSTWISTARGWRWWEVGSESVFMPGLDRCSDLDTAWPMTTATSAAHAMIIGSFIFVTDSSESRGFRLVVELGRDQDMSYGMMLELTQELERAHRDILGSERQ